MALKKVEPRYYYAAYGMIGGITGGVLSGVLQPWLAWGIAGVAMSLLPLPNKRRTFRMFALQLVVVGVSSALMAQLIYSLM
jgi:hypothetical protein